MSISKSVLQLRYFHLKKRKLSINIYSNKRIRAVPSVRQVKYTQAAYTCEFLRPLVKFLVNAILKKFSEVSMQC